MIDIRKWIDRVDNLLDVQKQLYIEKISTTFTRRELIELKNLLNTLIDLEEQLKVVENNEYRSRKVCRLSY